MLKRGITQLFLFASFFWLYPLSCTSGVGKDYICMEYIEDSDNFSSKIDSIVLIPLSSDILSLLGDEAEMHVLDNDFILADPKNKKIIRFDSNGNYLNSIGMAGRAFNEYYSIQNIQCSGDSISVFSFPDKRIVYNKNGAFISSECYLPIGEQSYMLGDCLYTYNGYRRDTPYRMVAIKEGRIVQTYLKSVKYVMHLSRTEPIFIPNSKSFYLLDSYYPIIYTLENEQLKEYLHFDFGHYRIQEGFFDFDDPMKGAESLVSSDFAYIWRYFENMERKLVVIIVQSINDVKYVCGISGGKESWEWYQLPFSETFRYLKDNCLYCLWDYNQLQAISPKMRSRIVNENKSEQIGENSNYVVAKIYLH